MIPPGTLPPLETRQLPPPAPLRSMLGPGIILAGLALGSGEFILWPYITFQSQFVFFWACLLGVTMQYFINMEITRWTLATGEHVVTGFFRINRHFGWIFILFNVIPWMVPAWATSAAELTSWMIWGNEQEHPQAVKILSIAGLVGCGLILTTGPVIYETVERMQIVLVTIVMVLVVVLAVWLLSQRPDVVTKQFWSTITLGAPTFVPELEPSLLLGALAFAGAGGTMNLAQSDYIKEKGYGMGRYIGRMTSPITGRAEATSEIGFQFASEDPENQQRWKQWWRNANLEQLISFYLTCVICLTLLTAIAYCLTYDASGQRTVIQEEEGLGFVSVEANRLGELLGPSAKTCFLIMGIAILLTTEFGVLDAVTRISTNLVKVSWLRENSFWTESRLYYLFLWGLIGLGVVVLFQAGGALAQIRFAAAMNGGVMFIYSGILIYLNVRVLPKGIRMPTWRLAILVAVVLFFGYFTIQAIQQQLFS